MAWISLDEVVSSILNSDDKSGDFGLLESAREDKEGQEGGNISGFFPRNPYKCLQDGDIRSPLVVTVLHNDKEHFLDIVDLMECEQDSTSTFV